MKKIVFLFSFIAMILLIAPIETMANDSLIYDDNTSRNLRIVLSVPTTWDIVSKTNNVHIIEFERPTTFTRILLNNGSMPVRAYYFDENKNYIGYNQSNNGITTNRSNVSYIAITNGYGNGGLQNVNSIKVYGKAYRLHEYNLNNINHANTNMINDFINDFKNILPVLIDDNLILYGTNNTFNAYEEGNNYIITGANYMLNEKGEKIEILGNVELELSNYEYITTDVGRPNSQNIIYNYTAPEPLPIIENVSGVAYYNKVYLEWDNPIHEDFKLVRVYEDQKLIKEVDMERASTYINDLEPSTLYTFVLTAFYDPPGEESDGVIFNLETLPVPEIDLNNVEILNYHSAKLSFEIPKLNEFKKVKVYHKGTFFTETKYPIILLDGLKENQEHEFTLKVITTDGFESDGITIKIETPEAPKIEEIQDLNATSTHDRVDLSWKNPTFNPNFELVRIYRQDLTDEEKEGLASLFFGSKVSAAYGEYNPIFETNGTKFNDLTVTPESKYEYLLKTENKEGVESEGVTIQVTTDEEPTPQMVGVIGSENEDGDFTITWTSPTEGEVKIIVGGNEYATVPASDKSFTVPAKDVVKNVFGKPDVQVIPISKYGTPGKPIKPTEKIIGSASLPFSLKDVVSGAMELIKIVGPFIVLAFVLLLAPRIVDFVKRIFNSNNAKGWGRRL